MKGSIVNFTPMSLDSGRSNEEKIGLIIDAIKRNTSDIADILRQLEERIEVLENN